MPGTVRLHRVLKAPVERVFRACIDPDAMVRWMPPYGFLGKVHEFSATVGGAYRMSFINFGTGTAHSFGGRYAEITPHRRIRVTDRFDDPALAGEMEVTYDFGEVSCGTDLSITQSGIPDLIPPEMCSLGWQESLVQLAQLVEPVIPDGA